MKKLVLLMTWIAIGFTSLPQAQYSPSAQLFLSQERQTALKSRSSGAPERYIPATLRTTDCDALQAAGAVIGTQAGEWVTARIPLSAWQEIGQMAGVHYIDAGRLSYPTLNRALPDIGYDRVLQAEDMPHPYLGKDVIVGIVDIGFQWNHIAFRHADGSTRIAVAWNQNDTTGTPPAGYSYGSLFDDEESILSAAPCPIESHATHVASIAAGSATDNNPYGGVAREADLVLVEALHTNEGGIYDEGIIDGINFIFDYARSVGKPCVVNLSIGGYFGPHDGTSPFDIMCDSLQGEGRLIVGAMGNLGNHNYHLRYDFTSQGKSFRTGFNQINSYALPQVDIWSDAPLRIAIEAYNSNDNTLYATTGWLLADTSYCETVIERDNREVFIAAAAERYDANGLYNTMFYLQSNAPIEGLYYAVVIESTTGQLDMWNNAYWAQFDAMGHTDWVSGDNRMSLMEVGGTGRRITSVGAYVTTNTLQVRNGEYSDDYTLHATAPFSGRGFSRDGRMKPEVSAPGSIIVAALNRVQATDETNFYYSMTAAEYLYDDEIYYYGGNMGTSMASPVVTGTYALWLQAHPTLTPEHAKETLAASSSYDAYTTEAASTGYGKINPYAGLCYLLDVGAVETPRHDATPRLYPAVGEGRFTLLPATDAVRAELYVYNGWGALVARQTLPPLHAGQAVEVSLPSLPAGVYQVVVASESRSDVLRYIYRQ